MKIAVVHRSLEMLASLEAAIREQGDHECAWVAAEGNGVAARCKAHPPDVLLLDVALRHPSAAEITRAVLETKTCSVVLVGGGPSSNSSATYEAMQAGALDVVPLPGEDGLHHGDIAVLTGRLNRLVRVLTPNGVRRPPTPGPILPAPGGGARIAQRVPTPAAAFAPTLPNLAASNVRVPSPARGMGRAGRTEKLLAIGASTGGPQAVHRLLSSLPRPVTCSIAIVQHIDGIFAAGMTAWLSEGTGIPVKLAKSGERPMPGTALLADSDGHLVLTASGTFTYVDEPKDAIHRPSIDVFFSSLAQHWAGPAVAVLLTGMGRDGAAGLYELRRAGCRTIAQDEATSVVFGMPKVAIQLGAAEQALPIEAIGPAVGRLFAESNGAHAAKA